MVKKILLLIFIFLIIIIALWFGKDYLFPQNTTIDNNPINNQGDINQDSQRISGSEFLSFLPGLSNGDKEKIRNSDSFSSLLKHQAVCDRQPQDTLDDCLTELNITQIVVLNKPNLCSQVSQPDDCLNLLALNYLNTDACNQINQTEKKVACLDYVYNTQATQQNNLNLCVNISDNNIKQGCFDSIISQQSNESYCNNSEIVKNNLQDKCKSLILFNQAIINNNSGLCQQIPLEDYRQSCLEEI